jgi:hypothetical protein
VLASHYGSPQISWASVKESKSDTLAALCRKPVQLYSLYDVRPPTMFCTHFTTLVRPTCSVLTLRRSSTHHVLYSLYDAHPPTMFYTHFTTLIHPPCSVLTLRSLSTHHALENKNVFGISTERSVKHNSNIILNTLLGGYMFRRLSGHLQAIR